MDPKEEEEEEEEEECSWGFKSVVVVVLEMGWSRRIVVLVEALSTGGHDLKHRVLREIVVWGGGGRRKWDFAQSIKKLAAIDPT
jgi:hypothetical protein